MNLKDWQAMSPEEQKAYWGRATLTQRRELVDQGLSFTERPHPGIEFEKPPGESSSGRCCSIRDTLVKQLKDEENGVIFYAQMAGELGLINEDGLADVLNYISDNEFKHYLELRGIIDILTEQCNCQRKTLGPPFG